MLGRSLRAAKMTILLLAAASMAACEVQFTPQVTPLVLVTAAGSPHAFGTIGPAGTPSPLEASATAEAEVVLTMVALAQQLAPSPNRRGDPPPARTRSWLQNPTCAHGASPASPPSSLALVPWLLGAAPTH